MSEDFDVEALAVLKSLTLLCVEDDKITQKIYSGIFKKLVGKVIYADDGLSGYEKYLENEVDLVVTDYTMPHMNGIKMIEKIRHKDKNIPIILVSAVEDIEVITKAIHLHVNGYIKKPISFENVLSSLENSAKLIIANRYLHQQKIDKIKELEKKEEYALYQEDLAFKKELNILRNDFYYKMIDLKGMCLIDFAYKPLDTLSGDAYSLRKIDEKTTFYLLVDGMGKGISAAFSAVTMTTFVNHLLDQMLKFDSFDLHMLIKESIHYVQPILLDEEALAVEYIVVSPLEETIKYAKFGMPASLAQDKNQAVSTIKSNNPPLSKYSNDFKIDTYDISNTTKLLFHSDGLSENTLKDESKFYAECIEEDFMKSFTKIDFQNSFFEKIKEQEDDITFIFINRVGLCSNEVVTKTFESSLENVDLANEWCSTEIRKLSNNEEIINSFEIIMSELFMNAYEHGNLNIPSDKKHRLIADDEYVEALLEEEKYCDKKIEVQIKKVNYEQSNYLLTTITDEGEGFDTNILSTIFRNSHSFNGRGVFVSKKNSCGIYYNEKGNSVLFLKRI